MLTCLVREGAAADLHSMSTADAVKLAMSVPASVPSGTDTNVEARMKSIGLTITGGRAYSYDSKSELEQPGDKIGDLHFTIQATQPAPDFKRTTCDMWGDADFVKRNGKFYPENRTANWLMTGQCSTRFAKPR
jgi:hypothetical protein